jgi:hypothetical protein
MSFQDIGRGAATQRARPASSSADWSRPADAGPSLSAAAASSNSSNGSGTGAPLGLSADAGANAARDPRTAKLSDYLLQYSVRVLLPSMQNNLFT